MCFCNTISETLIANTIWLNIKCVLKSEVTFCWDKTVNLLFKSWMSSDFFFHCTAHQVKMVLGHSVARAFLVFCLEPWPNHYIGHKNGQCLLDKFIFGRSQELFRSKITNSSNLGGTGQRPKNPYSKLALLSGRKLRVRKIFARMIKIHFEKPNLPG